MPQPIQDPPVTPQRSRIMAAIRGKDTKPEMAVRRHLHACGLRYGLHRKDLPGRPDLVLPRHRAVVFVHGCFWHGHDCKAGRLPKTRTEWWKAKIDRNRERDAGSKASLERMDWRVFEVWECGLKDPGALDGLVGSIRNGPPAQATPTSGNG
jgi:DNA mismatch endonuclease (patch repair protein)